MELELIKLENGYKRFDPQRGMEYMLDLKLKVTVESGSTEIRYISVLCTTLIPHQYRHFTWYILAIVWTCWDHYPKLKSFLCLMLQKQLKLTLSYRSLSMKLKHYQNFFPSTKRFEYSFSKRTSFRIKLSFFLWKFMVLFLELSGNKGKCFTHNNFCLWCWRCRKSSSERRSIYWTEK